MLFFLFGRRKSFKYLEKVLNKFDVYRFFILAKKRGIKFSELKKTKTKFRDFY